MNDEIPAFTERTALKKTTIVKMSKLVEKMKPYLSQKKIGFCLVSQSLWK